MNLGRPLVIPPESNDWLREHWHMTLSQLAQHFGCGLDAVRKRGKQLGLPARLIGGRSAKPVPPDGVVLTEEDVVIGRMLQAGVRRQVICRTLNITFDRYHAARARLGLRDSRATGPKKADAYEGGDTDRPFCVCGAKLSFESWYGVAHEVCRSCGLSRPIPTKGVRKYDQRERMEHFWATEEERSQTGNTYRLLGKGGKLKGRSDFKREVA